MRVLLGECEFDSGRRLLLRHGRAEPLTPKAFQLLELLLDRRPEAVAKTELLERLWPGTFVSDASLYNLVSELRTALGDASRATRFIRTVPRYGYAFHGDARPAPPVDLSRPVPSGAGSSWGVAVAPLRGLEPGRPRPGLCRPHRFGHRLASPRPDRVGPERTTVEDLGSKNGTRVNGQRVERRVALTDGDRIRFGSVTITYRILDSLPSTVTRGA
jgi:DNA-binding winged helix-turn-helix (wHTH) protein